MTRPALRLAAIALALVLARPALGESDRDAGPRQRRTGNVVYTLPAGWETRDGSNDAEVPFHNARPADWMERDDHGGDGFYPDLYFLPGAPFRGDTEALKAWAAERIKSGADVDADEVVVVGDDWVDPKVTSGPRLLIGSAVVRSKDDRTGEPTGGVREALPFAVVRAGSRADLVYAEVDDDHLDKAHLGEAVTAMAELLADAKFLSLGATPLEPAPTPGDYDGYYWGTYLTQNFGMDMMMTMSVVHVSYALFPDGTFTRDLPPGGMTRFDYADAVLTHTPDVGTYRRGTDADGEPVVELHYASGETDALSVEEGGGLRDDQAYLSAVGLPPDGWTFEGSRSYTYYAAFGSQMMGNGGSASGGGTTTFHPDGTATSDGWHGVSATYGGGGDVTTSVAGHGEKATQVGRYAVDGGRLTLTEPDGDVNTWDVFFTDGKADDGTPKQTVWIGGEVAEVTSPIPDGSRRSGRAPPPVALNPLGTPAKPSNPLGDAGESAPANPLAGD